jgi:predicted regulator of Ras-like GTPase activity (Roadblock/LC7/MglB family)
MPLPGARVSFPDVDQRWFLSVLAAPSCEIGLVGYAMARLAERVGHLL